MVSEHVLEEPLQAPPQPEKVSPALGVAVSETCVPAARVAEQAVPATPQLMPPPATVPLPVTETLSGNVLGLTEPPEKLAVTLLSPVIVTVQVAPLEFVQPLQLVNEPPEGGVAVNVTSVPALSSELQPLEEPFVQAIPPPVTVPLPLTVTVRRGFLKVPVAVLSSSMLRVQLRDEPLQAPLQPPKTNPSSGVSTIVSIEPEGTSVEQSSSPVSQSMSSAPEMFPPFPDASPFDFTVSVVPPGGAAVPKVAITSWSSSSRSKATSHVAPLQSPPQPENVHPPATNGAALNVTLPVPLYETRQVVPVVAPLPQFIELLLSVTRPRPITCTRTVVVVAAWRPTAPPTPSASAASMIRLHVAALTAIPCAAA